MATRTFASLVPRLNPSVPGCPQYTMVQYIRDAAIRVCERTLAWRYVQPTSNLLPGVHEYLYDKPVGAEVHVLFDAMMNDSPLVKMTLEQALMQHPEWSDPAQTSEPRLVTQLTPDKYIVLPTPDNAKTYTVRMFYALKPSRDADGMDEAVFNELEEAILHSALQYLLVLPNVAWSDRELASYHAKQFLREMVERRARANLGNMRGTLSAVAPRFA
jgi:hypothetical protein